MNNSPKVSIIIPVHNAEKYLEQSVGGLINQTLKDIEIICVDDASTDDSLRILNDYAKNDSRVKVFHHDVSKSALGARKTGVLAAKGEYIMFLDADDYFANDACEIIYDKMLETNVEILHFPMSVDNIGNISEEKIISLCEYTKPYKETLVNEQIFEYCFEKNIYKHTLVNKVYKSDLCKKAYSKTEDIHMIFAEDLYVYFIIADMAKSYCGYVDKPLYYYCYGRGVTQVDNSYTLEKFEKNCQHAKVIDALKRYCNNNHCNDKKYDDIIKKYYDEWIIRSIRILDYYLIDNAKKGEEIIYRYWGESNVSFMRDKYNYVVHRKTIISTVQILISLLLKKGLMYTVRIIKY